MQICPDYLQSKWYKDIVHFLQTLWCLEGIDKSKSQDLKLKAIKYCILDNHLYWRDPVGILLKCVDEDESLRIMTEMHQGTCGGHLFWNATTYKILNVGCYHPSLFSDVYARV